MTRKNIAAGRIPLPLTATELSELRALAEKEGRSEAQMVKQIYLAGLTSRTRAARRSKPQ